MGCEFINTFRGENFEEIFPFAESINEADKTKIVRKYFVEKNFELVDYQFHKRERDKPEITIEIHAKANKVFEKQGSETLVKLMPFEIPQFEKPKDRKLPVHLDFSINKVDSIHFSLPSKYSIMELPKSNEISSNFGMYKLKSTKTGNDIDVYKQFILYSGVYSLKEYLEFHKFISAVSEIEKQLFIILKDN